MITLPDPLTPADADLQEFAFMPLDVVRLRDSSIAITASGDEFRCAVLLWCVSWHQIPAGSLPDDDIQLAQYAGFGRVVKEWQKIRKGATRGWIKCSDGRLYHPVVAEKVNEAWAGRVKYAEKKEAERARKAEERRLKKLSDEAKLNQQIPLDGADLSGGQNANVQRTDAGSPPENALKETVDSGQWTVDSGQLTSTAEGDDDTTDSGSTSTASDAEPDLPPAADDFAAPRAAPLPTREIPTIGQTPEIQLMVALRRLGVNVMSTNPHLLQWVADGVTLEQLNEAVLVARETKGATATIAPAYLLPIVEKIRNPPAAAAPGAKPKANDWEWKRSDQGITNKGRELGMFARGGESYRDFAARIETAIAKRKGQP